jgi:hypothetical protein
VASKNGEEVAANQEVEAEDIEIEIEMLIEMSTGISISEEAQPHGHSELLTLESVSKEQDNLLLMLETDSHQTTLSAMDPSSLTPTEAKACGGQPISEAVLNGSGKLECSTEEIAVVTDSQEPRL